MTLYLLTIAVIVLFTSKYQYKHELLGSNTLNGANWLKCKQMNTEKRAQCVAHSQFWLTPWLSKGNYLSSII